MLDQQHGNYKAYYRKRCYDTSERISSFRPDWFYGKKCIDIGCNEGAVTLQLAKTFDPDFIIGIDLDPRMIDAANAALKRANLEATRAMAVLSSATDPTGGAAHSRSLNPFLPRSIALTKTTALPISTSYPRTKTCEDVTSKSMYTVTDLPAKFPRNISFVCKNVIDFISATAKYDLVSCLSVTKWIHLTEGDSGLLTLFHIIYQLTSPGGRAIIEYQPWSSYLNNKKTSPTTLRVFDTIKIRPENFETILTRDVGFTIEARLGTPLLEAKGFKRPILVLCKDINREISHGINPSHYNGSSVDYGQDEASMDLVPDVEVATELCPNSSYNLIPSLTVPRNHQIRGRKRYFGELEDHEAEEMLSECDANIISERSNEQSINNIRKKKNSNR